MQVRRAVVAFDISFIPNQTYPANTDIDLTLPTASGGILPLTYTLARIGTGGFPGTLTFTGGTSTVAEPADLRFSGRTSTVYGTNNAAELVYTVTDSGTAMLSLTFTVTVVDVVADGGTVSYYSDSNLNGAITVSDVGGVDSSDMRIILPELHIAQTFTVTNYNLSATGANPAPMLVTFSGVALQVVPTPANITFPNTFGTVADKFQGPLTVCLSTAGVPGRAEKLSIYQLSDSAWRKLLAATATEAIVTNTPDDFVCRPVETTPSQFAVGYESLSVDFDNTLGAQTYVVGQSVALTLPPTAAVDNMGMLTYTLTPTASIPDGLSFVSDTRTLSGTPTTVTVGAAVTLTYTAIEDTTVMASLTFTVTVMPRTSIAPETTRLNEQILTRAASAMTAGTLAAVAARVESAAGGGHGSGKPLAFELDGRTSLHGLLEKNGKAMLEDTMDYQRLLNGASFVLPLPLSATSAGDDASAGTTGGTAVWGSSDFRNLADDGDGIDWDGKTRSTHLGIDKRLSQQILAGLVLSLNDASFDYADDADNSNVGKGEYQYSVVTINPYFGWSNAGLKLWGSVGFGQGEITIGYEDRDVRSTDSTSTDTTQLSVASGFNQRLTGSPGGSVHIKGDVALTQVAVEAKAGKFTDQEDFAEQDVESSRVRLLLSGERRNEFVSGGMLTSSLEFGARFDAGTGFEIGGGLRYANPSGNLAVAGNIRTLLARDYDELGMDFLLQLSPPAGRGLSLSLHPVWGKTQSTTEQLWDAGINEISSGDAALQSSLYTEVGYGVAASMLGTSGVLTPYTGLTTEDGETNRVRLGTRFSDSDGLSVDLEGARNNTVDGASHTVLLRGTVEF